MRLIWLYRTVLIGYATGLMALFFYGPRGWRDVYALEARISTVRSTCAEKKNIVAQLSSEEQSWHTNSFNKERIAREELQMARVGDTVFYR